MSELMTVKRVAVFMVCSLAAIGCGWIAVADDTADAQQQRIRQALEGTAAPAPTGDGILDDVLDVIKQQGSILKGSSLDQDPLDQDPLDQETVDPNPSESAAGRSRRAAVAEQLLKASRLLEGLKSDDRQRLTLIAQMRAEAKKLLND